LVWPSTIDARFNHGLVWKGRAIFEMFEMRLVDVGDGIAIDCVIARDGFTGLQLPTISAPMVAPSAMSVSRDSPRT
jgi:hypothetical protein